MRNITVRKANRIIKVTDNELDRYLANGYVIIDKENQPSNKVVDEPVPTESIKTTTRKRRTNK